MKQYTTPKITEIVLAAERMMTASVEGMDGNFNSGLGEWQEGLIQGTHEREGGFQEPDDAWK